MGKLAAPRRTKPSLQRPDVLQKATALVVVKAMRGEVVLASQADQSYPFDVSQYMILTECGLVRL